MNNEETLQLFKKSIPYFQVLSDDTRQVILIVLSDVESMTVGELAEKLPLSRPAISHHMKILKQEGLVGVKRVGTKNYYFATLKDTVEAFENLLESIKLNCNII